MMSNEEDRKFVTWKWITFGGLYLVYMSVILCRKSFSFALPSIMKDVGMGKDELGLVSSCFNLAYTFSKFFGGIFSDRVNPKYLLVIGVLSSGIITTIFASVHSAYMFAGLWFCLGIVQGGIWPACAKILKEWFPASTFATWYGVLNTTMNVACGIGPVLTALLVNYISWRGALTIYGVIAVVTTLPCLLLVVCSPTDIGYQSPDSKKADKDKSKPVLGRGTWRDLLRSPLLWLLCGSFMFVYMTRVAAMDWGQLYLIQERNQTEYIGSAFISCLESGGIVGTLVAGFAADRLVAMRKRDDIHGSPRMTVVIGLLVILLCSLHSLVFFTDNDSPKIVFFVIAFFLGFGIYGPSSLYGVMAIEAAPTHLSGTSHAFVSMAANFGAIFAGFPFSYVAKHYEWKGAFVMLELMITIVLLVKAFTRNIEYKMIPIKKKLH